MTGRRASDAIELLEILGQVSPESIFHHMHQYFLKPHVRPPAYPNDFAVWVADALEEKSLAERLANLNPFEFAGIEDVRRELVRIISEFLKENPPPRPVLAGKEFFFNEGVTLVIPTGLEAANMKEFLNALKLVDHSSIYFHFYEARLRIGKEKDDFSRYLASKISSLDPYMYTTEVLRKKIVALLQAEVG
jgi:hypothetical protein